jgi:hypothetical protein
MEWPNGARFAFTVFDDTDNATVDLVAPVYQLLSDLGLRTTKSVWVYPPRGRYVGDSLQNPRYLGWVRDLQAQGFEIGLHNVGDGDFSRQEILSGLEEFRRALGHYPRAFANHVSNDDNIYWWGDRFEWPFSWLYLTQARIKGKPVIRGSGHEPGSASFWGDAFKQHIDYARNLTFDESDTLRVDPRMPYEVRKKSQYSNFWFSSTDGHTVDEFRRAIDPRRIDRLEADGGVCIMYTHFASGFVRPDERVDPVVEERLRSLASRNGWFAPVSAILDHLRLQGSAEDPGYLYRLRLDAIWARDRVMKRWRFGR